MSCWILLRGLTREARHWGDLPERLVARLGGASVAALDIPGNGVRYRERSPTSVEAMVAVCRETLDATEHEPPYILVGMSLGAMVATSWASLHADEVSGVVLINSSSRALSGWHRRLRWQQIPTLLRIVATRDAIVRERRVLHLTTRHPPQPEITLLASWADWRRQHPVSITNAIRQLLAAARYRLPETLAPLPLLVLASAMDALVDPACSLALARAWGADLRVHPTAGHDLPLDDGDWVAQQVSAWWLSLLPE
ncbi:MAG: alpha/beta hydrolase [Caldimonas sp.]